RGSSGARRRRRARAPADRAPRWRESWCRDQACERPAAIAERPAGTSCGASWPGIAAVIHLCKGLVCKGLVCKGLGIGTSMTDTRSMVHPARALEPERRVGDTAPQPVRSLRDWLDHLAARERLLVTRPGIGLRFELAAIAKRLDGRRATLFPRPGGHPIPVVSGVVSDRGWMAEAMGVEPAEVLERYQEAALNPVPCRETTSAPAQEVVHRQVDLARLLPLPTHNEHDSGPYVTAGLMITRNPRTGKQNVS